MCRTALLLSFFGGMHAWMQGMPAAGTVNTLLQLDSLVIGRPSSALHAVALSVAARWLGCRLALQWRQINWMISYKVPICPVQDTALC
jgi:hypothetical protein